MKDNQELTKHIANNIILSNTTYKQSELNQMSDYELFYTAHSIIEARLDIDNNSRIPSKYYGHLLVIFLLNLAILAVIFAHYGI